MVGMDGPCREEPPGEVFDENEVGRRVSRGQLTTLTSSLCSHTD